MKFRSFIAFAISIMAALPCLAANWSEYANGRFNYFVGLPPGFSPVEEAANQDGGVSLSTDGKSELRVWGAYLLTVSFGADVEQAIAYDVADGWEVTYRRQEDAWAAWSGKKGPRVFYERAIAACDDAAAYFRIEYDAEQIEAFGPIVSQLGRSLRSGAC